MYACIFNLSWLGSSGLTEGSYKNCNLIIDYYEMIMNKALLTGGVERV